MRDSPPIEALAGSAIVHSDGSPIRVDLLTARIVRLRFGRPDPASSHLAERTWESPPVRVTPAAIEAGDLALSASPERLTLRDRSGEARLHLDFRDLRVDPTIGLPLRLAGEQHLYGLGGNGAPFDRLGASRHLWNSHVNHGFGADIAVPLIISNKGYALFFDYAGDARIDSGMSNDDTFITYTSEATGIDLYYISGTSLREVLAHIAELLGHAPMPPRWALGYMQSTRHFDDAQELNDLPKLFRGKNIPCDALVLLSTYSDFSGWNRGVGHLDGHPNLIPDVKEAVAGFRQRRFRVMVHEYPVLHEHMPGHADAAGTGHLLETGYPRVEPAGRPSANYHEGQRHIDFSRAETRAWWWEQHRALVEAGVDGWWLDGGEGPPEDGLPEGFHNRFDLWRQQGFFEGEMRDRPERRPFLLCRSGGPGMQRFGAACWSGDVNGSFAALEAQIATGLNIGLSGIPYWGTDIGGYYPTLADSDELFVRWFQFGAFCPIFRAHGRNWRKHLPWGRGEAIEAICRAYIELRYRLMPYTYTLAWQAHRLGLPLMRPLVLDHADDPRTSDLGHQFLWGDDLLVAPVTREGATQWPVYLPKGVWHDFWTHEAHEGPCALTVAAPLDRLPLFVRGGALVPTGPVIQHDGDGELTEITVLVYPKGNSSFTLYEDDGSSSAYRNGAFAQTELSCTAGDGTVTCAIGHPRGDAGVLPGERRYTLRIRMPSPPREVRLLGGRDATPEWHFEDEGFVLVRGLRHGDRIELA